MALLILQIMQIGIYSSVDDNINKAANRIETYVYRTMYRANFFSTIEDSEDSDVSVFTDGNDFLGSKANIGNGTSGSDSSNSLYVAPSSIVDVIVYDKNGKILNSKDIYTGLNHLKLDKKNLNKFKEVSVEGNFNEIEHYRYKTITVSDNRFPDAAYATIAISVNQLDGLRSHYQIIIITVMVIFWLLSVFASLYLAYAARKPIIESYEKQKNFVEDASHELRTPLAVLQNRLESLFRKPDETILDNFETIASSLDEVRNMRILTTNLLNLARRDDNFTPEIGDIEPRFFDTIFENYAMIADENGKTFTFSNDVNRTISSDATLIKQLMTIFFDNAVKYTEDDGQISVSVSTTDRRLLIQVADNGSGISDEDKAKIFDRFYRIDKARTRQTGGFGLGLSLAKQIATALEGTITVSDNDPHGTVFDIKITA